MPKHLKLSAKFIIQFLIVTLFSTLFIGIISIKKETSIIQNNLKSNTFDKAQNLSKQINDFISTKTQLIETISDLQDIRSGDPEKQTSILTDLMKKQKEFTAFFVADLTGQQVARENKHSLQNNSDRQYIKDILKSHKMVISNVIISKSTGKPSVVIAAPILNDNKEMIQIVGATLNLAAVDEYSSLTKLGKTGYAFVVDSSGIMLANPNKKLVTDRFKATDIPVVKNVLSGKSDSEIYEYKGEKYYSSYSSVKSTKWGVIVQQNYNEAMASVKSSIVINIVLMIAVIIICLILGYFFAAAVTKPVNKLVTAAEKMAGGDLNQNIDLGSKDEIGTLAETFSNMGNEIKKLILNIKTASNNVNQSTSKIYDEVKTQLQVSDQVSTALGEISKSGEHQSVSVVNTLHSVENIVNSVEDFLERYNKICSLGSEIKANAGAGVSAVDTQNNMLKESSESINNAHNSILELSNKSSEITKITGYIYEITSQTDMLALNASIEAARAGEAGKGFAVVANEIKNLAEKSQKAVERIDNIINEMVSKIENTVEEVNDSTKIFEKQNEISKNTTSIFLNVTESISTITDQINNMSDMINKIKTESNEINAQVENISAVLQENVASTQEVTASSEEQNQSIKQIEGIVDQLMHVSKILDSDVDKFKV